MALDAAEAVALSYRPLTTALGSWRARCAEPASRDGWARLFEAVAERFLGYGWDDEATGLFGVAGMLREDVASHGRRERG